MIGLSLSFCVSDILEGKIEEGKVSRIIAATAARNEADWQEVFAYYRKTYWRVDPKLGESIARRLIKAGKVEQPRLWGKGYPDINNGHWCVDASDVVYIRT